MRRGILVAVTFLSGCCLRQLFPHSRPALDRDHSALEAIAAQYAWHSAPTRSWETLTDTAAVRALSATGIQWGGVNRARSGDEVLLYFIEADAFAADERTCGRDPAQRDTMECRAARSSIDNCAVISNRTVVCDVYFMWKLDRDAFRSAVTPRTDEPTEQADILKRTDRLRKKFFAEEIPRPPVSAVQRNLGELEEFFSGEYAEIRDVYEQALAGLWHVVLFHELGHVVNGHVWGDMLPRCAVERGTADEPSREADCAICKAPWAEEVEADEWAGKATGALREDASGWAADFFLENYFRAIAWVDSRMAAVGDEDEAEYVREWMHAVATKGHPSWVSRFAFFVRASDSKQLKPVAERESNMTPILERYSSIVRELCARACDSSH